jgi:hypothetical protein
MFSVIAGSGHCGSTWLASVLDSQIGVTFYHHFREEMTGKPWELLDLKSPDDPLFLQYWRWIGGDIEGGPTGDANSWPPHLLPAVNEVRPIDRVIYLTRNGIQQLNSLATTSPALSRDPMPVVAEVKLKTLFDIALTIPKIYHRPNIPSKPYEEWSRFEKLCLMILANEFMPDWLRDNGLNVVVYDLGLLLSDVGILGGLAPRLDKQTLEEWQRNDINRKTEGGRAPSTIWRKWSPEQRAAYRSIVGVPEL